MIRLTLYCAVILLVSPTCFAMQAMFPSNQTSALVLDQHDRYKVAPYAGYFEDSDGKLSIEHVIDLKRQAQFSYDHEGELNFGFTQSVYWYHFTVKNINTQNAHWVLVNQYSAIDRMDVYLVDQDASIRHMVAGDSVEFDLRSHPHIYPNYDVVLEAGKVIDVYVRAETEGAVQAPLIIVSKDRLDEMALSENLALGIYYGILIALCLYNAAIFLLVREKNTLFYILYILFFGLFQFSLNGLSSRYVWSEMPAYTNSFLALFMAFSLLFATLFSRSFLRVKEHSLLLNFGFNIFIGVFAILSVNSFIGVLNGRLFSVTYNLQVTILAALAPLLMSLAFGAALFCWKQGVKEARYYIMAFSCFMMGIVLYALKSFGILPANLITENAMQIGSALEMILLSFALADRFRIISEENSRIEREAKETLEQRVNERTYELEQANLKLQKLSSTDGLTGVYNRRYFDKTLFSEIKRATRAEDPLSLVLIDIDHFKLFNDTWGHLLGDQCLITVAKTLAANSRLDSDVVARYGGEEFAIILPQTTENTALEIAGRIRTAVENRKIACGNDTVSVTISLGIASIDGTKRLSTSELISRADKALYLSKDKGRNQVTRYTDDADDVDDSKGLSPVSPS